MNENFEVLGPGAITQMIKNIARLYQWPPAVLMSLYLDDLGPDGLIFWDKDAQQYERDIMKKGKK